jgi:hypothetical protein
MPVRLEVAQVKTSLFLSKNDNISSSHKRSCPISDVLFGTLGSSVSCFVSHSASISVLASLGASAFAGQIS